VKDDTSKELSRARKAMGPAWVEAVKKKFLLRAAADDLGDFGEDENTSAPSCPVCQDGRGHSLAVFATTLTWFEHSLDQSNRSRA
jgi:hypothetical protein